ncbi:phage shock protein PspA [Thalassotalea maritima]|uniref:phage shock protein PspA n=1 Tax=Thalassotalea maritima TaxID=3242416 RepID=UPI00352816C6
MGMFSRFTDIINANINALLEKAENPEKMIRLIIQEMEETLVDVRTDAAKYLAEKKTAVRQQRQLESKVSHWQQNAELALSKGRDDLARAALQEKQNVTAELDALNTQVESVSAVLDDIQTDCVRLQEKLQEAKRRQEAITMRQQSASVRLQAKQVLHTTNIDGAIAKFERYQQKVDELEAQVESFDFTAGKTLNEEIAALEKNDDVERELQELKQKAANA